MFKKPYEISLWEDRLTYVDGNFNEYDFVVPDNVPILTSYYKERKICVIGSEALETPTRALNPQLKRNVNGTNTLTFQMYSKYYDEKECDFLPNPFIRYLSNERKVKLKYTEKGETKWLDLVIKKIAEDSSNYLNSYTAIDLYVNELSKTGFNLVFDEKLGDNTGTVSELAKKVLKDTDWRIGEKSELIQQKHQEALYKITLNQSISAIDINNPSNQLNIPEGATIYTFYSCYANRTEDFFQFLYNEDGAYAVDENRLIQNANEYYFIFKNPEEEVWPYFAKTIEYTNEFCGERLVRSQERRYDPVLKQYVSIYTGKENTEYYGEDIGMYTSVKYISPTLVRNLISNGSNFVSTSGWKNAKKDVLLDLQSFPTTKDFSTPAENILHILKFNYSTKNYFLCNTGISDNSFYIDSFIKDEKYMFRMNCKTLENDILKSVTDNFYIIVSNYNLLPDGNIEEIDGEKAYFKGMVQFSSGSLDPEGYLTCELPCNISLIQSQLKKQKIGLFIFPITEQTEKTYCLIDVQFFKKEQDSSDRLYLPDGKVAERTNNGSWLISDNFQASAETIYHYYHYGQKVETKEEIEYIHKGKELDLLIPKFNSSFEKVRSITISESNRFNILQKLSETFECWCRFEIKHKPNGEIMFAKDLYDSLTYDAEIDASKIIDSELFSEQQIIESMPMSIEELYYPLKFITFHKNVGQKNQSGFLYGVNLKSIKRNLQSDTIVTKLLVKDNNNQFAENGSCSIRRAKENPSGESFLYDFSQYINQGLLNKEDFEKDLYIIDEEKKYLGFYSVLKSLNIKLQELEQIKKELTSNNSSVISEVQYADDEYNKMIDQLRETEEYFQELTSYSFDNFPANSSLSKDTKVASTGFEIKRLRADCKKKSDHLKQITKWAEDFEEQKTKINEQMSSIMLQKEKIIKAFENKYSRFIQEGPWNSDDYLDDNLYYLDAESTLHNSSRPKVTYDINVIEISSIKGYENYSFELGDITYIQDTDFFGWDLKNGRRTPHKENIVVTEINSYLDSPDKNTIKVQNFRTQFEDLFQRMAATIQKVEFHSGAYEKATTIITPEGAIVPEALDEAFASNNRTLQNANNESVKWDEKGILTTNLNIPSEIVCIVGGGVFLSVDGGASWTTGITGQGINAKTITTGTLNTGLVTIFNGNQPTFRWDPNGINAYKKEVDGRYTNKTYVRFDQFGLYGIENQLDAPTTLDQVWDKASFSLTWKGFKLKTGGEGGSVVISTDEDFAIYDNDKKIINIGCLNRNDSGLPKYGMVIKDQNDKNVFIASHEGLKIGGWTITPDSFEAREYDDEQVDIGLYSSPQEIDFGQEILKKYFFVCGSKQGRFSVDKDGQINSSGGVLGGGVYFNKEGLFGNIGGWTCGEDNVIISPRTKVTLDGEVAYQETIISPLSITIKYYKDIEGEDEPIKTTSKDWIDIM